MTTQKGSIPVDWKLRTRARFLSEKPLPSFNKMKPSEQASGVTGLVRCMSQEERLDSGANARFHSCCLVWQTPSLPWLELCPRPPASVLAPAAATPAHKDALHRAWTESLYSVFQLVRAQQCPYFYIVGDSFTCLFRASGVCGKSEPNAAMVPTTRGLRKKLQAEEISFTMPLRREDDVKKQVVVEGEGELKKEDGEEGEGEEGDDAEEWLQSMGVAEEEVKKLRSMDDEEEVRKLGKDGGQDSLVYVEGIEAQALFNWLLNCKAVTVGSGVPPTILAPVAFLGATLKPLSVRTGQVGGFCSVEVRGPLLPNAIHALCRVLSSIVPEFAATFATLDSTTAFALMDNVKKSTKPEQDAEDPQAAFNRVNLRDCGLTPDVLPSFCSAASVHPFDSLKYSEEKFSWVSDSKS
ncbi:protein downstream neighbor of son homolog [Nilaparvata lugens]|uniref:protein downstream neighbor of son homolog n=1 Tax=Nilaparvata lugens TaxID=108931 RepID=UPI00193D46E7|nr:protein downstream neighbor of son homolog [Nilaparvata lugens]XP_039293580.1 protein downstream neighbor of son homolog [Nilaparvata lugens]XP_039293581.1 protein downstream neighbor of son homolog [Nilaparvata lugens]